jgi:hypothetical protein
VSSTLAVSLPRQLLHKVSPRAGDVKEEVVKALVAVEDAPEAYKRLWRRSCMPNTSFARKMVLWSRQLYCQCGANVSISGSLFFEEMSCCSYDPQRRQFACPVKMDGATRRVRSILSWALTPTNCNYAPIWGNALNYRIRLDQ